MIPIRISVRYRPAPHPAYQYTRANELETDADALADVSAVAATEHVLPTDDAADATSEAALETVALALA